MPLIPNDTFKGKKVLVTGHTGFKGAWLSLWLKKLGADVIGFSLPPKSEPNLFDLINLERHIDHHEGNILDLDHLKNLIESHGVEIVFHLAAQSIVLEGYSSPQDTFATNTLGTVNLLEACRNVPSIEAVVVITTDKCYENRSQLWGYREIDRLGGKDPYSASKAMAELAVSSYHASFYEKKIPLASARCGNVIGGGDFSKDRLLPDCYRALMNNQPIPVRNPASVRPWLYVLDSLYGYLTLAEKLMVEGEEYSGAWNFGPREKNAISVQEMVEYAIHSWGNGDWIDQSIPDAPKEMGVLKLNWEKASHELRWHPHYDWKQTISATSDWYRAFHEKNRNLYETCIQQIEDYENDTHPVERGLSH